MNAVKCSTILAGSFAIKSCLPPGIAMSLLSLEGAFSWRRLEQSKAVIPSSGSWNIRKGNSAVVAFACFSFGTRPTWGAAAALGPTWRRTALQLVASVAWSLGTLAH